METTAGLQQQLHRRRSQEIPESQEVKQAVGQGGDFSPVGEKYYPVLYFLAGQSGD